VLDQEAGGDHADEADAREPLLARFLDDAADEPALNDGADEPEEAEDEAHVADVVRVAALEEEGEAADRGREGEGGA